MSREQNWYIRKYVRAVSSFLPCSGKRKKPWLDALRQQAEEYIAEGRVKVNGNTAVIGCTVEDGVLIGMGSTILNGAVIGEGSVVAAGALVLEGAVVPPYSLVAGVPAKVKKALSAEEVKSRIDYYTPRYVREAKLYAGSN
mgnify:CR=1 FL=1